MNNNRLHAYKIINQCALAVIKYSLYILSKTCISGFLEKEIKKDGIPMLDTGDNPDAPAPREMIDLEVSIDC